MKEHAPGAAGIVPAPVCASDRPASRRGITLGRELHCDCPPPAAAASVYGHPVNELVAASKRNGWVLLVRLLAVPTRHNGQHWAAYDRLL